jgi:hypothetical protein
MKKKPETIQVQFECKELKGTLFSFKLCKKGQKFYIDKNYVGWPRVVFQDNLVDFLEFYLKCRMSKWTGSFQLNVDGCSHLAITFDHLNFHESAVIISDFFNRVVCIKQIG